MQRFCEWCKAEFLVTSRRQQFKKFCSKRCRSRATDVRQGKGVPTIKNCTDCGMDFHTVYRRRIYCSKRCGERAHYKRSGPNKTYQASKDLVYADKIAKGCSRCPERRPACLQYHHLDPAVKVSGIGRLIQMARPEIVIFEMQKCILLCANCHFVEENGDGYRPGDSPDVER